VRTYVGVTDNRWAAFLAALGVTEANFWFPSTRMGFAALRPGEPFLFKTHHPENRVVGGGFFEHYTVLRASEAWAFMGQGNGAATLDELVARVHHYRSDSAPDPDPMIGCVILNDLVFFSDDSALPGPPTFSPNIVRGKSYDDPTEDSIVEAALARLITASPTELATPDHGPISWTDAHVRRRLGQGGFQAVVLDAYQARCAITGHRIRPTLQAAHIRPVTAHGPHAITNGLLLRSDVHTMFDRGYLSIDPKLQLLVSPRLRQEFGNGEEFYRIAGQPISVPSRRTDRPAGEYLEWHRDTVYKAS
jgi:putative restriction endonuclease